MSRRRRWLLRFFSYIIFETLPYGRCGVKRKWERRQRRPTVCFREAAAAAGGMYRGSDGGGRGGGYDDGGTVRGLPGGRRVTTKKETAPFPRCAAYGGGVTSGAPRLRPACFGGGRTRDSLYFFFIFSLRFSFLFIAAAAPLRDTALRRWRDEEHLLSRVVYKRDTSPLHPPPISPPRTADTFWPP